MSQTLSKPHPVKRLQTDGSTRTSSPPRTQAEANQIAQADGEAILANLKKNVATQAAADPTAPRVSQAVHDQIDREMDEAFEKNLSAERKRRAEQPKK